ncbi:Melanoma-associated antigen 10 [Sciurus carolinensis]|uniref:Melanoma-associated antigen 10 n=1 Tax=Sciurus carolinensis TaxID=30640 RepID=A0AA41SPD1_SCICA|nr:Melanoma-associated antigen 10 [Sciurus carolinensis]
MPPSPKRPRLTLEQDLQDQNESEELVTTQAPAVEQEDTSSISSSFHFSFPSTSSSSSPSSLSCSYSVIPSTLEEKEVSTAGISSTPQSPQGFYSSSTSCSKLDVESRSQEVEGSEFFISDVLDKKVDELVQFLLFKYQTKELVIKAEMIKIVIKEYKDHFPIIFGKACKFIELVFGISVTEVDPNNHTYIIYDTLDLTFHGMLSDDQGMPKIGLLIFILSTIFMEGNCITEEKIWEVLKAIEIYAGREHFIYGDPRQLITKEWVQKKYLEYHQVPDSEPVCYKFQWGPRACAEANKKKILEFLTKLKDTIPSSFPAWYKEALKDAGEPRQ